MTDARFPALIFIVGRGFGGGAFKNNGNAGNQTKKERKAKDKSHYVLLFGMPTTPNRPCPRTGCPELIGKADRLCAIHRSHSSKEIDSRRASSSKRGYGARWRKLRIMVLRREPICKACGDQPATEVDHIVARVDGGSDDQENLQGLCKPCHSKKTAKENSRWGIK